MKISFKFRALLIGMICLQVFVADGQVTAGKRDTWKPKSSVIDPARLLTDIETLSADDMAGRSPTQPAMQKARDYVARRFRESDLTPFGDSFAQEFTFQNRARTETFTGVNYIGFIKGKKFADKYIIITAHYDHVGIQNNQIFNGADDDASGTAALFAFAKAFKKDRPDHSLIFVAFDAEEQGLRGSRHFVANLPVPKETVLLNVNMDMISRNVKNVLYASGGFHYAHVVPPLNQAQKKAKVKLLLGHDDPKLGKDDWTNQSDHGSFHAAKIPFVYFGVEDHPDYHKPTDDFANIMPEFYVRAVETIFTAIKLFDKNLTAK
ncbi:MAG: M28 family peptidase [Pyrinomonadaceae bacterium]